MISKIHSSALFGIDALKITLEVSVTKGLGYTLTGLPDDAIKESLSRISMAIYNSNFQMPRTRLVINLAPANLRKTGTAFDLPITLGILLATEQITDSGKLNDFVIIGELGLDGSVFPVRGALCMAFRAKRDGYRGIILPVQNAAEASLVDDITVYGVGHLSEVISFIQEEAVLQPAKPNTINPKPFEPGLDFKEVRGQKTVKRALEIAAAGGHNTLIIGPPGNGKSMLAKRLPSILPPMTIEESLETTRIHSVVNNRATLCGLISERPFRSPHHTTSDVALAGGGDVPVPGEISLAHNGVLFLDELPEFRRSVIEVLRQPLEDRKVLISRAKCSLEFPASFMLLAAMNPCLCGYFGHASRKCSCSSAALNWYRRRISGPILERIDLQIESESLTMSEMMNLNEERESSATILKRVIRARQIQSARFVNEKSVYCNAHIPDHHLEQYCALDSSARGFLFRKMDSLLLSARSYSRILKVARTIADLGGKENIELDHVAEALSFRCLDKPVKALSDKKRILKPIDRTTQYPITTQLFDVYGKTY